MKLSLHVLIYVVVSEAASTCIDSGQNQLLWSNLKATRCVQSSGLCKVPAEERWILDVSMDVQTLTVEGQLIWDTSKNGLELRSSYILVQKGGCFMIGSKAAPMTLNATIYIKKSPISHTMLGERFLGGIGSGRIQIHGRPLHRTWSLLGRTAEIGSKELILKDDPTVLGWKVGDRIGVATTSRAKSSTHQIVKIAPASKWKLTVVSASAGKENPQWNEAATAAIDGGELTRWSSFNAAGGEHWLQLDLESYSEVESLRILFDKNRYSPRYRIEVRSSSTDVWAQAQVANGKPGWQAVTIGRKAKSLRVIAETLVQPDYAGMAIFEVQVFGKEVGSIAPSALYLSDGVKEEHWGGMKRIEGHVFEMAAEVVNLERSIVITGDHEDFHTSQKGLHTVMASDSNDGSSGIMDIRYTRVEFCGQRNLLGRYCFHFHLLGECPDCVFEGNAVVESQQVGITIHGTHRSLVESNVLWNTRGVGIYVEDGNEMHNQISRNVVICESFEVCRVPWQGHTERHAGIFLIGMTNDLLENRVAGHENCIWTQGSAAQIGQGAAKGRVCPQFSPFGLIKGNVCHDNRRFGLYLDNQHPRRLLRDSNGMLIDVNSCEEFTKDGKDNGVNPANVVEDEFDWHNEFVGQYTMGDVEYRRYVSVNNFHGMYWKHSKNFADGKSHHIRDSIFANDASDKFGQLQLLGPAGSFTFRLKNVNFVGGPTGASGALCAGQHCGLTGAGGPCNVQYLMESVNFSGLKAGSKRIAFGVNSVDSGYVLPSFVSKDDSLGGFRSVVSKHLSGFALVDGCTKVGDEWGGGYGCKVAVRRLTIWSSNIGRPQLIGAGYEDTANYAAPVHGLNAGLLVYDALKGAYGAQVVAGATYKASGAWRGTEMWEFSDSEFESTFKELEPALQSLKLQIINSQKKSANIDCELSAHVSTSQPGVASKSSCDNAVWIAADMPSTTQKVRISSKLLLTTATTTSPASPSSPFATACSVGELVSCCEGSVCPQQLCSGNQCCPGSGGSITCPSASVLHLAGCTFPKKIDCTVVTTTKKAIASTSTTTTTRSTTSVSSKATKNESQSVINSSNIGSIKSSSIIEKNEEEDDNDNGGGNSFVVIAIVLGCICAIICSCSVTYCMRSSQPHSSPSFDTVMPDPAKADPGNEQTGIDDAVAHQTSVHEQPTLIRRTSSIDSKSVKTIYV